MIAFFDRDPLDMYAFYIYYADTSRGWVNMSATPETDTLKRDQLIQTRVTLPIKESATRKAEDLGISLSTVLSILVTKFATDGKLPAMKAKEVSSETTLANQTEK